MTVSRRVVRGMLGRYLWLTNTVSGGALLATGDAIQQNLEKLRGVHRGSSYDWPRTGRMFLVGLSQGLPHHVWYLWLDRVLPGTSFRIISQKILMDQVVAAPFFAFSFFIGMGLLERRSLTDALQEFKEKFPAVYAFDWIMWPPTQFINFYWIPGSYRVLYINFVTVIWDVFLSFIKHKDLKPVNSDHSS